VKTIQLKNERKLNGYGFEYPNPLT